MEDFSWQTEMTVQDYARWFVMTEDHVRTLLKRGVLQGRKEPDGTWRVSRKDVTLSGELLIALQDHFLNKSAL